MVFDIAAPLAAGEDAVMFERLRKAETIGRPVGAEAFLGRLEQLSGRALRPAKRGRKPRPEISALSP